MIQVQWHRGLFAESVPMIRQAAEDNPGLVVYRAVLALFAAHEGRHDEARNVLADLAAGGFDVPYDLLWTTTSVIAAEAASVVGDADTAALLYERLSPYADQVAASRTTCQGAVAYHLGLLASTLGRRDEALAHHALALEKHSRLRSPFLRARSMLALADLVQGSEPDRAASLVADAGELVERFGIGALRDHLQALDG